MMFIKRIEVRSYERGIVFRDGEITGVLGQGQHWLWTLPWRRLRVDVLSLRDAWIGHRDLDLMVKAGVLRDEATVLGLAQSQRALVWVDGVFDRILGPGRHGYWTGFRAIHAEQFDARVLRLQHADLAAILAKDGGALLESFTVAHGFAGLVYHNGALVETLGAGQYAFWKGMGDLRLFAVDARESVLDVAGQDIMTSDKVTLRLNAVATFRVTDAARAVTDSADYRQSLYREVQLALRAAVGTRTLDALLAGKDSVVKEVEATLRGVAAAFGVSMGGFGIRDIILPGDMKELLNKVTEAAKAAEASLITRREETSAMRSQANTARLLENNPTLMRLRELEVIEKIALNGKLTVMVGDKGLSSKVLSLLD